MTLVVSGSRSPPPKANCSGASSRDRINFMMEKYRVGVECADYGCKYDSQQRPKRRVATKDEIEQAYEMLTPAERRALRNFADCRVRLLGRASCGRTWEDLFQDVLVSTFTGAENTGAGRHWNKNGVNFFGYLRGAIQSISCGWGQKFNEWEPSLESDLMTRNAEGDEMSPFENIASSEPAADQCLIAKEEEDQILRIFKNNPEATQVLQGLSKGMEKNEIMQRQGYGRGQALE
jgi:hypothetical protein